MHELGTTGYIMNEPVLAQIYRSLRGTYNNLSLKALFLIHT